MSEAPRTSDAPRPPSVRPAAFPIRDGAGRASWIAGPDPKVQRLGFGDVQAGTGPSLRTLPPPASAPGLGGHGRATEGGVEILDAERPVPDLEEATPPREPAMPPEELRAALDALAEREDLAVQAALDLAVARRAVLADAEEAILALAVEIAEAIVGTALERDDALQGALVREALGALGAGRGGPPARLRASSMAHAAIVASNGAPEFEHEGLPIEVCLDESLEGYGVIAESDDAQVDARVRTRLDAVRRALIEDRRRHVSDEGSGPPSARPVTAERLPEDP